MAFVRRVVDPVLARGLDRYVIWRSKVRARLGLRQNKPWWQRPDSAATGAQLSIAINLTLVGVGVPMGFNAVVGSREKERAALRVGTDVAQVSSDQGHGALALLNDRRRARGLAPLGILPSNMTPEQLESAALADRAGLAPDSDPHELVEGVHADAAPAWETELMRKCSEMHKDTMKRNEAVNRGMTHRTAGSIHGDPAEVLAEARRQGLDI